MFGGLELVLLRALDIEDVVFEGLNKERLTSLRLYPFGLLLVFLMMVSVLFLREWLLLVILSLLSSLVLIPEGFFLGLFFLI